MHLPSLVTVVGDDPPVLALAQVLGTVFGVEIRRRKAPDAESLDKLSTVIQSDLRSGRIKVWNLVDELRNGHHLMGGYLCIVPDSRSAVRVSDELGAHGLSTDSRSAHRVLAHPLSIIGVLTTLAEMNGVHYGVSLWRQIRIGCPHIQLERDLRSWRDGGRLDEEHVTELLNATDPHLVYPHEVANRLVALRAESGSIDGAELAARLCACLGLFPE